MSAAYHVKAVVTDRAKLAHRARVQGQGSSVGWIEFPSYRKAAAFASQMFNMLAHFERCDETLKIPPHYPVNPDELVAGVQRFSNEAETIVVMIAQV